MKNINIALLMTTALSVASFAKVAQMSDTDFDNLDFGSSVVGSKVAPVDACDLTVSQIVKDEFEVVEHDEELTRVATPVVLNGLSTDEIRQFIAMCDAAYIKPGSVGDKSGYLESLQKQGFRITFIGDDHTRAMIAVHDLDKKVYVSFKGTSTNQNIWTDLDGLSLASPTLGMGGHRGFLAHYGSLREQLHEHLKHTAFRLGISLADLTLIFTGHSLGGATATLATLDAHNNGLNVAQLVTVGAPSALSIEDAKRLDETGIDMVRIEQHADPVTAVGGRNTAHVGRGVEVDFLQANVGAPHLLKGYEESLNAAEHVVMQQTAEARKTFAQKAKHLQVDVLDKAHKAKTWLRRGLEKAGTFVANKVATAVSKVAGAARKLFAWI